MNNDTTSTHFASHYSNTLPWRGKVTEQRGGGWYNVVASFKHTNDMVHNNNNNNNNNNILEKSFKVRSTQMMAISHHHQNNNTIVYSETNHMMNNNNYTSTNNTSIDTHKIVITDALHPSPQSSDCEIRDDHNIMPIDNLPPPTIDDLDTLLEENIYHIQQPSTYPPTTTTTTNNNNAKKDPIQSKYNHELLAQLQHFSTIQTWITFSDLHVSPSNLQTCLDVLHTVHDTAIQYQQQQQQQQSKHHTCTNTSTNSVGILFLGDFWHHRGSIRVDCLNAVLDCLSNWTVPMIMIPGNHDQVTLGGEEHSLSALRNAYFIQTHNHQQQQQQQQQQQNNPQDKEGATTMIPGPLILSRPTRFHNALFIPHIRDISIMQSILGTQQNQCHHPPMSQTLPILRHHNHKPALFVHADVTGALMNDQFISTGGVSPKYFPAGVNIYSGHFHKAHTVTYCKRKDLTNTSPSVVIPSDSIAEDENVNGASTTKEASSGDNIDHDVTNRSQRGHYENTLGDGQDQLVKIRYVGSPFQTSLAEANQTKALLVLDSSKGWECVEEIPLDIGKKHWRVYGAKQLLEVSFHSNDVDSDANPLNYNEHNRTFVRPGDRVVVSIPFDEIEDARRKIIRDIDDKDNHKNTGDTSSASKQGQYLVDFDRKVERLRSMGASVEVRQVKSIPTGPMIDLQKGFDGLLLPTENDGFNSSKNWLPLEDMTPKATFTAYLYQEVQRDALSNATASALLDEGIEIMEASGVERNNANERSNDKQASDVEDMSDFIRTGIVNAAHTDLEFESVTIKGFGSFMEEMTYPLHNRGLVLLRGSGGGNGIEDSSGAEDSNGSGKTTLAMSTLWALTGSLDGRLVQDSKVADVVNDSSKSACVIVRGKINKVPFTINRIKTSKGGSLSFSLNNVDMTRQSIKETQNLLEESMGYGAENGASSVASMLSRTAFYGQHSTKGLLEATDASLKEELSLIVPLSQWKEMASKARKVGRKCEIDASEIKGILRIRQGDIELLKNKMQEAKCIVKNLEIQLSSTLQEKENFLESNANTYNFLKEENIEQQVEHARIEMDAAAQSMRHQEHLLETQFKSDGINELSNKAEKAASAVRESQIEFKAMLKQEEDVENELSAAREQVSNFGRKWGIHVDENFSTASKILNISQLSYDLPSLHDSSGSCPTCGQHMTNENSKQHFEDHVAREWKITIEHIAELEKRKKRLSSEIGTKQSKIKWLQETSQELAQELVKLEMQNEKNLHGVKNDLKQARDVHSALSRKFSEILICAQNSNEKKKASETLQENINRINENLLRAQETYETICLETESLEHEFNQLTKEGEYLINRKATMSSLADAFGPWGVQTYVLQNTINALRVISQTYLDELSNGALKLNLELGTNDRIMRSAAVLSAKGEWMERPLSSLSGGQWRRCSLALSLGFADLLARRGRLRSSLLVLDEPLTHLDSSGRSNVGKLLRKLLNSNNNDRSYNPNLTKTNLNDNDKSMVYNPSPIGISGLSVSTIIIILQDLAAEEMEEIFDSMDEVSKIDGKSEVKIDG